MNIEQNPDASAVKAQGEFRVLMVSLDPGLLRTEAGSGDVLERHKKYAASVTSLDIIVLGGSGREVKQYDSLTIHSTGAKGVLGFLSGLSLAKSIARSKNVNLIVTQDPHATGWIGMCIKKKFRIPLLVDVHGDFIGNVAWLHESLKHRVYALLQRKVLRAADSLRVVSYGIEQKLQSAGIASGRVWVINTPVNVSAFQSLDEHQKILVEEIRFKYQGKKIIVFCGRLVAAKNLPFLLSVAAQLRKRRDDWMLLIIGEGEERKSLEAYIKKLHLASHVQLVGPKPQRELAAYYHAATCMVLPSTNESFGKVIIEAGVCGVPCLATSTTGAMHIIIDGKTGFLVPLNDTEGFLEILDEMLEYSEQTKQLGAWAREAYTVRYDAQKTLDAIIGLWKETARI